MIQADGLVTRLSRLGVALGLALILGLGEVSAQSIFTMAGGGTEDGRPATLAALNSPFSVTVDDAGNVYFSDSDDFRIRRVDGATGIIKTVAGNGIQGFSGDGGPATEASFKAPQGVAVDEAANRLYIADLMTSRVRRVDLGTGIIDTIAGGGNRSGEGFPATEALLLSPVGVAVDDAGNLYIADSYSGRIRRVDGASGIITTVAGGGDPPLIGDGGPATEASLFSPQEVAVDDAGNLYIADMYNSRVRRVDGATGIITTVAGTGDWAYGGDVGDGGPATEASLGWPVGVALDRLGDLYVGDDLDNRIRRVDVTTGIITTFAGNGLNGFRGDGGPATEASFVSPSGVALDGSGNLCIADEGNRRIRRIDATTGIITTFAGGGQKFTGDEGPATIASLTGPAGVALDDRGNLYVADTSDDGVRRIDAVTKMITTVAGGGDTSSIGDGEPATEAWLDDPRGVAVDDAGHLYIAEQRRIRRVDGVTGIITTVAGNGDYGFSGDGGPATLASFRFPYDVTLDDAGILYIADSYNNRVRRVDRATGIITTIAGSGPSGAGEGGFDGDGGPATEASLRNPHGVAVDDTGNLYIADTWNNRVRRVDGATGIITTVAGNGEFGFSEDGGPATETSLHGPEVVAVDRMGNLYIVDLTDYRLRRVDGATGIITTVVGNGLQGFSGDGGPATKASINWPWTWGGGVALDGEDNLYIADTDNHRVRVVFKCVEVGVPDLLTPMNGSQGLSTFPALGWERTSGTFRYDVYIDVASPPERLAAVDIEATTFSPANLQPLTTYYWKVIAKGDPFCEPFRKAESEVWSFTTESVCDVPGEFETTDSPDHSGGG